MRSFFDHTGDVGAHITAGTLAELFREAALAFTETLTDPTVPSGGVARRITLTAPTLDDLMVEWLSEILYLFEVQNLLIEDAVVEIQQGDAGWTLAADIVADEFDAARHAIKVLIKGITYHRLNVEQRGSEWHTDIVFDI
jgi:SHS2 domain-containing protein